MILQLLQFLSRQIRRPKAQHMKMIRECTINSTKSTTETEKERVWGLAQIMD